MSKKNIITTLLNLDVVIAGLAFLALVAITFFGVFRRYFFNSPILWQEEVQVWLFLWIVFFGGSAAFRNHSHIAIEMVVEMFPKRVQRILELLVYLLVIVVLAFLAKYSFQLVRQFIAMGKATSVLKIPNAFISIAIPVGCVLMILNQVVAALQDSSSTKADGERGKSA